MGYKFNPFTGKLDEVGAGSAASPGGSDTEIQYNDSGAFAGSADLTWDDTGKVLEIGGDINLDDGGTYETTLQVVTPTAARTISFPDATGTIGLVAGSSGQLLYNASGANAGTSTITYDGTNVTLSGRFISSLNGAASAPPGAFTGTWFTGGTSTTTKPHFLCEPAGTTSTAWSTSGTGFGVNAASGFAGNLLDLQTNGTSFFRVNSSGGLTTGIINTGVFDINGGRDVYCGTGRYFRFNGAGPTSLGSTVSGVVVLEDLSATNTTPRFTLGGTTSSFAAIKGNSVTLETRLADDSDFAQHAAAVFQAAKAYTVSALPGSPVVGQIARVTDATAPVVGTTVAGGGAAAALCWYNGASWSVIGV